MLSSLTQLLAIEPLALVGTAVAEPDERELAVAQRRHDPRKTKNLQKARENSISALKHLNGEQMQQAAAATNHFQSHSLWMRMLSFLTHRSIASAQT
jgi:hypothetical protein